MDLDRRCGLRTARRPELGPHASVDMEEELGLSKCHDVWRVKLQLVLLVQGTLACRHIPGPGQRRGNRYSCMDQGCIHA